MTKILLSTKYRRSSFHIREIQFARKFAENIYYLTANGFYELSEDLPPQLCEKAIATAVFRELNEQAWTDTTIYALIAPKTLDQTTNNMFHRTLRVVLERTSASIHYPYDTLRSIDARAAWMTTSINDGEILPLYRNWGRHVYGIDTSQYCLQHFFDSKSLSPWD